MKRLLILLFPALLVAAIGWWLGSPANMAAPPKATQTAPKSPPPASTVNDPATVFQKAFWKRPTAEDQVLQAERREWQDDAGISKWQWFIAVQPSQPLVDHLITNNAFALAPSPHGRREAAADPPPWFPKEGAAGTEVFTSSTGALTLLWDKKNNLLHATGSGHGFQRGASEPVRPVASTQPQSAGRIPTTPPPKPRP